MRRLYIIGAGGHGKVVADIAVKCGRTDIAFLDDNRKGLCVGFPIEGTASDIESLNNGESEFVIAVGNNEVRKQIAETYDVHYATLIHPSAQIGIDVSIGDGSVVMAGAVINPCTVIGKHCIINSGAIVEHDNVLGDYVHVSPGVALGGTVTVGDETHVGIGATVKNGVSICENCIVGAGAAVVKDLTESGVYIGIPARGMRGKLL